MPKQQCSAAPDQVVGARIAEQMRRELGVDFPEFSVIVGEAVSVSGMTVDGDKHAPDTHF